MAGFVPNTWVARLLEATAGKTAITADTVYAGLASALPEDPYTVTLANLTEIVYTPYARVAVPAFGAATTVSPLYITTPTQFTFATPTADMAVPATFLFLADAASGTVGNVRYVWPLAEPVQQRAGEPIIVPASTLIIE